MSIPEIPSNDPFKSPQASSIPPKPGSQVVIAPIERLKRAKALIGDQYWLYFGIVFVGLLVGGLVPMGILLGPMACGMFMCFRQRMQGQRGSFDPLFKGFDHFGESLIPTLIHFGMIMLLFIPLWIIMFVGMMGIAIAAEANDSPELILIQIPMILVLGFLVFFASAAFYVPMTFVYPLIVDRGMKGMAAFKESWRMAKPDFFKLYKMYLVYLFIYFLGAMCCVIPAYLFLPIVVGAVFTLYQDYYGLNPAAPQV